MTQAEPGVVDFMQVVAIVPVPAWNNGYGAQENSLEDLNSVSSYMVEEINGTPSIFWCMFNKV